MTSRVSRFDVGLQPLDRFDGLILVDVQRVDDASERRTLPLRPGRGRPARSAPRSAGCRRRRRPSATITNSPMSPVAATCVPPHSSMLNPGMLTTRTVSPYFSPNNAMAPDAIASDVGRTFVSTAVFFRICSLTIRSMRSSSSRVTGWKCTKSKRRRSGATSEPFCATCAPSTWRKRRVEKVRRRVVAARRVADVGIHFGRDDVADLQRAGVHEHAVRARYAGADADQPVDGRRSRADGAEDAAGIGHLAAGFEVERRLPQRDVAVLALVQLTGHGSGLRSRARRPAHR